MGAGVQAEWVACLKSEGSDWVSFRSRCSPRPAATHASDVLFLIGCVAHAPGKLTQMLCKSSQQAPPVWIRSREQISIAVGRQVLRSLRATVLWSVPWDCLENSGAESHETCRVARLPVAPPCISRRPAHSLSHQLVATHRADVHDAALAFIAHEIASSLKVRVIWTDPLKCGCQVSPLDTSTHDFCFRLCTTGRSVEHLRVSFEFHSRQHGRNRYKDVAQVSKHPIVGFLSPNIQL